MKDNCMEKRNDQNNLILKSKQELKKLLLFLHLKKVTFFICKIGTHEILGAFLDVQFHCAFLDV